MATKGDCDKNLIFSYIYRSTLKLYGDDINTNEITTGVYENYNNYNINNTAY